MSYRADKLVIDTHTHGHTDPQMQAMKIPEGQNWSRVTKPLYVCYAHDLKIIHIFKNTQQIFMLNVSI